MLSIEKALDELQEQVGYGLQKVAEAMGRVTAPRSWTRSPQPLPLCLLAVVYDGRRWWYAVDGVLEPPDPQATIWPVPPPPVEGEALVLQSALRCAPPDHPRQVEQAAEKALAYWYDDRVESYWPDVCLIEARKADVVVPWDRSGGHDVNG